MTLEGEVTVSVAGSQHAVTVGDVLAFPGDQKHGYRNSGAGTAVALSVVLPMPLPVAP
jgi:quercetin dioxygenase-like cupin family protein